MLFVVKWYFFVEFGGVLWILKKKFFIYRDIYKMYDWFNWFWFWYFIWILKMLVFCFNIDIGVWKCKIIVIGSIIDKLLFRKGL